VANSYEIYLSAHIYRKKAYPSSVGHFFQFTSWVSCKMGLKSITVQALPELTESPFTATE
jgi:hypothetical protein